MVGCKVGANAIRLHDEVVLLLAKLFRSLRLDAIVEPIRLFAEASGDRNSQRPDILLRNPRGFGRQVIMDVAVTGLDGQSRPTEDHPNRHLQVRYDQKVAKYGHVAEQNRFQFIPAIFFHTGKLTLLSKICLGSRLVVRLLLLKVMPSRLKLILL